MNTLCSIGAAEKDKHIQSIHNRTGRFDQVHVQLAEIAKEE